MAKLITGKNSTSITISWVDIYLVDQHQNAYLKAFKQISKILNLHFTTTIREGISPKPDTRTHKKKSHR